nr:MAG: nonstructural protein [Microvirus sp.]
MNLKIYSIRDSKGEIYNTPFFQKSHGEAERNFRELTRDDKSMICKYPEDFDLYYLGTYDDQNGTISSLDSPQHIAKAVSFKQQDQQNVQQLRQ